MTTQNMLDPAMSTTDASAPPKKRRRRAAATGAADDCFTCRKSQTKCDRRRPYCGQCLEHGKDCAGYKTTLTWGVGVASRGKLRGLTCPVAKQSTAAAAPSKMDSNKVEVVKAQRATGKQNSFGSGYVLDTTNASSASLSYVPDINTAPSANLNYATLGSDPTREVKVEPGYERHHSMSQQHYQTQPSDWSHHGSSHSPDDSLSSHTHTSFVDQSSETTAFPPSATTMSGNLLTNPGADYPPTPVSLLQYGDAFPQYSPNAYTSSDQQQQTQQQDLSQGQPSFFDDSMTASATLFTPTSQYHQQDMSATPQYPTEYDPMTSLDPARNSYDSHQLIDGSLDFSLTLPRSLSVSQFYHLTPRMQFLMDYYDKHICSVLVAFDSPSNPYRQHVLELATHNEGLQNAIAALAINNMRMRNQRQPRAIGFVEEIDDYNSGNTDHSWPTPEESLYKNVSVAQLQMQLADSRNAQDDSILATLLILCLFHVCDSGFSKFKTQLEGVQKLLSMRDRSVRTGFIGWVEMFFTWFDVMTSTVNDRETEIRGDRLDMLQYSSNLGALEQFSGCDGRLFKLIARLGRLNLLSQNRSVKPQRAAEQTPRPHPPPPPPRRFRAFGPAKGQKRRMLDPAEFTNLDGNGWGSTLASSSDEGDNNNSNTINSIADTNNNIPPGITDTRHEFWAEWNDIRLRLQSWSMTDSSLSPTRDDMNNNNNAIRTPDMIHINEMFRSSALLYTERLAYPHMPSSSPNFQSHVRASLSHFTAIPVTSCVNKFLLWPLFITGTECVDSGDRADVRKRCVEISRESGFYNNLSVLQVLERVWAEQGEGTGKKKMGGEGGGDVGEGEGEGMMREEEEEVRKRRKDSSSGGGFGQAFRWRRAMNRGDGEYIIV